jgi:D-beta-D-heptose 7-phosphate kinase/D-beta-D-heptose 1-phosphate adenosyltransferase
MTAIDRFSKVKVLCVGDVMADHFVSGDVTRISPESPVPVFLIGNSRIAAGGAGNVARNIVALGGAVTLVGVIGTDEAGVQLRVALASAPRLTDATVTSVTRRTTVKTRFVAQGQHILRTDREDSTPLDLDLEKEILSIVLAALPEHQVLLLSDYAKGVLTAGIVTAAIAAAKNFGIPVVVDPKSKCLDKYRGANVITPNAKEAEEATGIDVSSDESEAERAGRTIIETTGVDSVVITRAQRGMSCILRNAPAVHLAASAREVFDVVGAGDTGIATLALALGVSQDLVSAARLANAAAGIVVGKHGTATVNASELEQELAWLGRGTLAAFADKILSRDRLLAKVSVWRLDGLRIGFTNGCFDLLHVGHLSLLNFARAQCDRLVLGLNSDASARRLKGPSRPINAEIDRAMVLAGLSDVDAVVIFDEETPLDLITQLSPDVLVKGADYRMDQIVGADVVHAAGGRVLTCDIVPGKSTTSIVSAISAG